MRNQPIKTTPERTTREEILRLSARLFAQHGYDGVSMRDVAAAVGFTQAALYYHFANKDQLYLEAVTLEVRERGAVLQRLLASDISPSERLVRFVAGLARMVATDKDYLRLMQWVLLDTDEARQRTLGEEVFSELFVSVRDLANELDPHQNAHMLAMSIYGLVIFHFQVGATRKFMPGHEPRQDRPEVLAKHVIGLLYNSLGKRDGVRDNVEPGTSSRGRRALPIGGGAKP